MCGHGRVCGGVHSCSLWAFVVVWAFVLVCGQLSSLYRWSWQPGGHLLLLALHISQLSIVMWLLWCFSVQSSVGGLGWISWVDLEGSPIDDNNESVVCCLVAMILTAMWHLEWVLERRTGTDGDNLLWRVTMLHVVTVRRDSVVGVVGELHGWWWWWWLRMHVDC